MKKVLSIVLAIAMIATMSVVSFAAAGAIEEPITAVPNADTEISVKASYTQGERIDTYKVSIAWEDFTYNFGSTETWNPDNHTWDLTGGDAGKWTIDEKTITVTNDSSLKVLASAAYDGEGTLDFGEAVTVDAWTDADTAGVAELSATWEPDEGYTIQDATDLGTITVTIAAVA